MFPLRVDAGGRYLVDSAGQPFLIHGDTPWSIEVQLTHAQIDTYLNDRSVKGFTAILFEACEHYFSSQSPAWKNAQSGAIPFTTTTAGQVSWGARVEEYWRTVDYIVNGAKARGIACFITPAYLGFGGGGGAVGDQGWNGAVTNASAADLISYGAFLASRYTQGNVVWVMGGDYAGSQAERDKQWNIVTGIRSVRTTDLITGHTGRGDREAFPFWSRYAGFNLNNTYGGQGALEYELAATAYARTGPMPFFFIEGDYDGDGSPIMEVRRQAYESLLGGACGHFFGNTPIWGFGEPNANAGIGAAAALASALSTPATLQIGHLRALFSAQAWWKLQPRTDTSLVTSALGTGSGRICPALARDGSFALIWKPTSGVATVNMAALAPALVRARFFDTVAGTYSDVAGSPFANTGTRSFSWPGESVLVLDAA